MTTTPTRRITCSVTSTGRITWHCDECGQPIKAKTGYLTVDRGKAMRQYWDGEEREYQRKAKARAEGHTFTVINVGEMMTWPSPVSWQVLHKDCDQNLERDDYWFGVERANTLAKLLNWAAHLSGKNWLQDTDWDHLLRKVATAGGGANA